MTFSSPSVLLLLIVPLILAMWVGQRRHRGVAVPVDHHMHGAPTLLSRFLGWLLRGGEMVPAGLLAVAIVLFAGPQALRVPEEERILTNIQICMDVSGSMSVQDRYGMARTAIESFTEAREGDAFGFTIFGSYPVRWTPLTRDLATIRHALAFANPRFQPPHMGGTMIGKALRFSRETMMAEADDEGDRLIILVSDGVSFDLNGGVASEIADELKEAKITLYHVHVGTDQTPPEVIEIARETGGKDFVATDPGGLTMIFNHIDRMQPARFRPATAIPMDFFQPFTIAGISLLGILLMVAFGLRPTPW